jgi:hypothetical protein
MKKKTKTRSLKTKADEMVALNVQISFDLRQWAKEDAKRSGYTLPEYIEELIKARKKIAPPLEKKSLITISKSLEDKE